jgi:hypothetical protein
MTNLRSSKHVNRRGGNLLFFGLQALIVLGVVLFVINSGDDKPRLLPTSHEASFGDEVLVTDNSVGCPTEEVYEKWLNTVLDQGDVAALEVAERGGCQLVNSDTAGVVVKISSHRLSGACVRPKGEPYCLWISESRLRVTNPSSIH